MVNPGSPSLPKQLRRSARSNAPGVRSSPDLVLAVSHLASAYMGAVSFSTLAQAGSVDERTPGALLRADRMFAVQYQPWTPHNF